MNLQQCQQIYDDMEKPNNSDDYEMMSTDWELMAQECVESILEATNATSNI